VNDEPELEQLLGPLRDGPVALSGTDAGRAQRERLLPGLRAHVGRVPQARRRARMRRQIGGGVLGGGALLALTIGVQLARPGAVMHEAPRTALRIAAESPALMWIDASGAPRAVNASAELVGPGELRGADAVWSQLSTARGVELTLSPHARLRAIDTSAAVSHAQPELELLGGEVHCRVPHLGTRDQFSIATPDAQVIVHGTVFSVRFDPNAQTPTCVRVEQGLVEVRQHGSSVLLGPGAEQGCTPSTATAAPAKPGSAGATAREQSRPAPSAPSSGASSATPPRHSSSVRETGTLDEENRLLSAALAAEREGDRARARAMFSELLRHHPASPLAPEARRGITRTR
jgi:hypothetical protein